MFCPLCNPEYMNSEKKLVHKEPERHMTTGFVGADHKKYLKCTFCGYQELDPDATQPPDVVDGHKLFELSERHDLLTASNEKLKQDNLTLAQDLKATQDQLAKAHAALGVPAPPSGVAPGGWIPPAPRTAPFAGSPEDFAHPSQPFLGPTGLPAAGSVTTLNETAPPPLNVPTQPTYPKLLSDPTSSRPDLLVHNAAEEAKARADGFTVERSAVPSATTKPFTPFLPPKPVEVPPAHTSVVEPLKP